MAKSPVRFSVAILTVVVLALWASPTTYAQAPVSIPHTQGKAGFCIDYAHPFQPGIYQVTEPLGEQHRMVWLQNPKNTRVLDLTTVFARGAATIVDCPANVDQLTGVKETKLSGAPAQNTQQKLQAPAAQAASKPQAAAGYIGQLASILANQPLQDIAILVGGLVLIGFLIWRLVLTFRQQPAGESQPNPSPVRNAPYQEYEEDLERILKEMLTRRTCSHELFNQWATSFSVPSAPLVRLRMFTDVKRRFQEATATEPPAAAATQAAPTSGIQRPQTRVQPLNIGTPGPAPKAKPTAATLTSKPAVTATPTVAAQPTAPQTARPAAAASQATAPQPSVEDLAPPIVVNQRALDKWDQALAQVTAENKRQKEKKGRPAAA